jgi:TatD DNase family protein
MEIFDTHAHYDDEAFDVDRDTLLGSYLPQAGVCGIITAGTNVASSLKSAALAEKYDYIHFAAGIHPEDVAGTKGGDIAKIADIIKSHKKAVAVGEIGLDYHYDGDRELQQRLFTEQLTLAQELGLPVIVHDRDAHADTLRILKQFHLRGTLHCFSGSAESAVELLSLGFYIGFTGAVTFKNNKKAAAVLAAVPQERILVETDCPYMAPEPFRGRRCDSSMIRSTLEFIAKLKGISADEMARITAQNARCLFGIKGLKA